MKPRILAVVALALFLGLTAAPTLAQDPFILAGPGVNTVIIKGAVQPAYQYPYWGADGILQRFIMLITGWDRLSTPMLSSRQPARAILRSSASSMTTRASCDTTSTTTRRSGRSS